MSCWILLLVAKNAPNPPSIFLRKPFIHTALYPLLWYLGEVLFLFENKFPFMERNSRIFCHIEKAITIFTLLILGPFVFFILRPWRILLDIGSNNFLQVFSIFRLIWVCFELGYFLLFTLAWWYLLLLQWFLFNYLNSGLWLLLPWLGGLGELHWTLPFFFRSESLLLYWTQFFYCAVHSQVIFDIKSLCLVRVSLFNWITLRNWFVQIMLLFNILQKIVNFLSLLAAFWEVLDI